MKLKSAYIEMEDVTTLYLNKGIKNLKFYGNGELIKTNMSSLKKLKSIYCYNMNNAEFISKNKNKYVKNLYLIYVHDVILNLNGFNGLQKIKLKDCDFDTVKMSNLKNIKKADITNCTLKKSNFKSINKLIDFNNETNTWL